MQELPSLLVVELRKRGEKRIKSIFINPDGALSVFLHGDLPVGKKSFNYTPGRLPTEVSIPMILDDVLVVAQEVLDRPNEVPPMMAGGEAEYDAERSA